MKYGYHEYAISLSRVIRDQINVLLNRAHSAILVDISGSMPPCELNYYRDALQLIDLDDWGHTPVLFFNAGLVATTSVSRIIAAGDWPDNEHLGKGTSLDEKLLRKIRRVHKVTQVIALSDGMFAKPEKYPVDLSVISI